MSAGTTRVTNGSAAAAMVLAVDGGNVKTDLALVAGDGRLVSVSRGGPSTPHSLGLEGCVSMLGSLLTRALDEAGLEAPSGHGSTIADVAQVMLAGADLEEELVALRRAIGVLGWAETLIVDNDTLALLRTGTDRGWGVAVVCGGGINAVGRAPDGREVRFPALGAITGDWGGGIDVGLAALGAAARSADGRGRATSLERIVPAHFGLETPLDVARALHVQEIPHEALGQLASIVFAQSSADGAAAVIADHLADEVSLLATATLRRLELLGVDVDVVLGGGVLRAAPSHMIDRIERSVLAAAPGARIVLVSDPPIVGAALLGLDVLGINGVAGVRARAALSATIGGLDVGGVHG
jgi:N-acetylglucosamine kinase-like BadF-type ATPase